jgi:hypothetical protein
LDYLRFIAALGAVLTILQLAIGPFVQQVIQYPSLPQNVTHASIPIAMKYDISSSGGKVGTSEGGGLDVDISMKAAIMNAALDLNAPSTDFDISPACSTGNCTWPLYQSLAICSTCADISDKLEAKSITSGKNWTLPNGLWLEVDHATSLEGLVSMTVNNSYSDSLPTIAFPGNLSETSLLDFFVLVGPSDYTSGVETAAVASECVLNICLQSYSASEVNGTFHEKVNGDPQILTKSLSSGLPFSSGNFSFDAKSYDLMNRYLGETLYGQVKGSNAAAGSETFPDAIPQALFLAMNGTAHNLDSLASNLAKSMTRNMRTRSNAGGEVTGNAALNQTFIHIEWAWMSLPAAVLFGVLIFLLIVVLQSSRGQIPTWKDNSLATLFYGLDIEGRQVVSDFDDKVALEDVAGPLKVKLEKYEGSWGLRTRTLF